MADNAILCHAYLPVVALDEVLDHLPAPPGVVAADERVEEQELRDNVRRVEHFDAEIEQRRVAAHALAEVDAGDAARRALDDAVVDLRRERVAELRTVRVGEWARLGLLFDALREREQPREVDAWKVKA